MNWKEFVPYVKIIYCVRVLTRAFVRNYSKCMVRLNTQTEFAVILYQRS